MVHAEMVAGGLPVAQDTLDSPGLEEVHVIPDVGTPSGPGVGPRRFVVSSFVGIILVTIPYLWTLWGPWETPSPLRKTAFEDNFYDLQARAMFHGHFYLAKPGIGIETFTHGGHDYTYFGPFASIIRMPILAVTSNLDGKLTAPFMLTAWMLTALFLPLLFWRVRTAVRGGVIMGWAEATSFGVLVASCLGGTVWMLVSATPYVFSEDLAWSMSLTVGALFCLLGVMERPSWLRVLASIAFVLAANLNRVTTGWALAGGALLIAAWFALGRGGSSSRRWAVPMAGVAGFPLLVGCAINYSKFGVLFGVSNFDQEWTHVNAYRRQFLASNHNSESGLIFAPTNLLTYFRPDGIRLSSVFPFITLPAAPPRALAGVLFDRRYRTASIPASMPLQFLLGCWGMITAFRPHPFGGVGRMRILLLAMAGAGALLFIWGYIAPRYLADFVPFLVLASSVGMVDVWRRMDGCTHQFRVGAFVLIAALGTFTIVANIGMAVTPNEEWNAIQTLHYVQTQKGISDVTGRPLSARVSRSGALPAWAPEGQLMVVGHCDGLYISNGEDYSTIPTQQYQRATWMVVQLGHRYQHTFNLRVGSANDVSSVPLVTAGTTTVSVVSVPRPSGRVVGISFAVRGHGSAPPSYMVEVPSGSLHRVVVVTDPSKRLIETRMDGIVFVSSVLVDGQPILVHPQPLTSSDPRNLISVVDVTASTPGPSLCRSLNH